jgi:hypothetical protein
MKSLERRGRSEWGRGRKREERGERSRFGNDGMKNGPEQSIKGRTFSCQVLAQLCHEFVTFANAANKGFVVRMCRCGRL